MSEVQPKVGEKWESKHGGVSKIVCDLRGTGYSGVYCLIAVGEPGGDMRRFTKDGLWDAASPGCSDLVRKYVPRMPTGVWGVDNLDDKLLAELKEWHAAGCEIEDRPIGGYSWRQNNNPFWNKDFHYRARGCTSEPQPQRKPITAEEAFELWGKVICDEHGEKWRVVSTHSISVELGGPSGRAPLSFEQLLHSGYTLDGHVICSGMSTKPQPGSVHVKLPSANG